MITVDISNIWGDLSLPDLLSAEKEVFDAHMKLTDRNAEGCDYLGWLDLPTGEETDEIRRIRAAAKRIEKPPMCLWSSASAAPIWAPGLLSS